MWNKTSLRPSGPICHNLTLSLRYVRHNNVMIPCWLCFLVIALGQQARPRRRVTAKKKKYHCTPYDKSLLIYPLPPLGARPPSFDKRRTSQITERSETGDRSKSGNKYCTTAMFITVSIIQGEKNKFRLIVANAKGITVRSITHQYAPQWKREYISYGGLIGILLTYSNIPRVKFSYFLGSLLPMAHTGVFVQFATWLRSSADCTSATCRVGGWNCKIKKV